MNIGRYNVGGGDKIGETVENPEVSVNEKAKFYRISDAQFTGTEMKESSLNAFSNVTFSVADADFGFTKGKKVGNLSYIGWINELGAADDATESGGNLHFNNVEVAEAGSYTVKILLTLSGTNGRNVAIKVNDTTDYVVDAATINANTIASASNNTLFMVSIPEVQLNAGVNKIDLDGSGDWTLDFVKMAVIKSEELGILPEADKFLHKEHIIRSDSGVPGYTTDVTKMDLENNTLAYYEENFAAADEESGYAWNYDWDTDKNQINILKAAIAASGKFHAEAFSNSPPYFMTESGCSSGNVNANADNLRKDCYTAFATDCGNQKKKNGIKYKRGAVHLNSSSIFLFIRQKNSANFRSKK